MWEHEVCSGCNGYFPIHERECANGQWTLRRLVDLNDVVEFLRRSRGGAEGYANLVEREFGEDA